MSQWVIDALYLVGGIAAIAVAVPLLFAVAAVLLALVILVLTGLALAAVYLWDGFDTWMRKKRRERTRQQEIQQANTQR